MISTHFLFMNRKHTKVTKQKQESSIEKRTKREMDVNWINGQNENFDRRALESRHVRSREEHIEREV